MLLLLLLLLLLRSLLLQDHAGLMHLTVGRKLGWHRNAAGRRRGSLLLAG